MLSQSQTANTNIGNFSDTEAISVRSLKRGMMILYTFISVSVTLIKYQGDSGFRKDESANNMFLTISELLS